MLDSDCNDDYSSCLTVESADGYTAELKARIYDEDYADTEFSFKVITNLNDYDLEEYFTLTLQITKCIVVQAEFIHLGVTYIDYVVWTKLGEPYQFITQNGPNCLTQGAVELYVDEEI